MIYIYYLTLLVILLAIESKLKPNNKLRWIIPLIYILLIGFRGANVGVDTQAYHNHYYIYGKWGCDFIEVGFDWLNRILYALGFSHVLFFVLCAAIPILLVAIMAGKCLYRREYTWFMLLFCTTTFVSFCNGMRQNIACGIFFALMLWLQEKNIKTYKSCIVFVIGIFIGSLFHASTFFMLPVFFMRNLRIPNTVSAIIYLVSFVFVFYNVSSYFPSIEFGQRDYGKFIGGEMTNREASSLGFLVITSRNIILMIIMFLINAYKRYPLLSNMTLISFVLTNLGFNIPIIGRVNMYFVFFYIMLLSIIFTDHSRYNNNIIKVLIRLIMLIVIVLTVYGVTSPSNKVNSYSFYWEDSHYTNYLNY